MDPLLQKRLLPGRIIFLDVETTGLDPNHDDLVEVGMVVTQDGEVVERYGSLCRPSVPISHGALQTHHITEEMVQGERSSKEVLQEALSLAGKGLFISHNAQGIDEPLIRKILGNEAPAILDSMKLLMWLEPCREIFTLESFAETHEVPVSKAHRAQEDAEVLAAVCSSALQRAAERIPLALIKQMVRLVGRKTDPWAKILRPLGEVVQERVEERPETEHGSYPMPLLQSPTAQEQPSQEEVASVANAVFGPEGKAVRSGLSHRPSQLKMAQSVENSFSRGVKQATEAPTGTGKSLSYLVSAVAEHRRSGGRVLVATHTKNLQHQLFEKDAPQAQELVSGAGDVSLLVGQENYFCRRRSDQAAIDARKLEGEERGTVAFLYSAALQSPQGLTSDVKGAPWKRLPNLRGWLKRMQSESHDCLGDKCPLRELSAFMNAREAAKTAQVVITNHALALLYPLEKPEHAVFDEAHLLEDSATDALTQRARRGSFARALLDDGSGRFQEAKKRLRDLLMTQAGGKGLKHLDELEVARAAAGRAFTELDRYIPRVDTVLSTGEYGSIWLEKYGASMELQRARQFAKVLADASADATRVAVALEAEVGDLVPFDLLRAVVGRLLAIGPEAAILAEASGITGPDHIQVLELRRDKDTEEVSWDWTIVPVDVRGYLANEFEEYNGLVLTSATLYTDEYGQSGVLPRIGWRNLDQSTRREQRLPSVFPSENVQTILLTGVHGKEGMDEAAAERLADTLVDTAKVLDGGMLALFSAKKRMWAFGDRAKVKAGRDLNVAIQGDMGREKTIRRMRGGHLDLVGGVRSFFNGIDVPGKELSMVVLENVPFDPPTPIIEARKQRITEAGGSWFMDYYLPRALIMLRQGIGRLQRSETDSGFIALVADKFIEKAYSHEVLKVLPGDNLRVIEVRALPQTIEEMQANPPMVDIDREHVA